MERAKLFQVLQKYPTLKVIFGEEWFLRNLLKEKEDRHLLIELLLEDVPEVEYVTELFNDLEDCLKKGKIKDFISIDSKLGELLYFSRFLKNLESYLKELKEVKGFSHIVKKMRESYDPLDFLYTIEKIEIFYRLFEDFDEIEVEKRKNKIYILVEHKERTIIFCFVTPDIMDEFVKEVSSYEENSILIPIVHMRDSKKFGSKPSLYDIKELPCFVIYDRAVYYGSSIPMGLFIGNPSAGNKLSQNESRMICRALHLVRFPIFDFVQFFSKRKIQKKLRKGGFYTNQNLFREAANKYLANWMKSREAFSLLLLLILSVLNRQSDKYEYRCFSLSFILHLSALNVNAENWWRELMRLEESLSFLQDGIAQIQNLETILSSKRKASEEIKISLLLPLYTSTVEGIFQGMLRIVATSINIIEGKPSKNISKIGIPKLVEKINSFDKRELEVLTKGYNQTLRNAYSHGTFHIDLGEKKVIASDRKKEEILTFSRLKKMRKRLEQASFMVALSLVAIFFRITSKQEKQ